MSNLEPIDPKEVTRSRFLGILEDIEKKERRKEKEEIIKRIKEIKEELKEKENQYKQGILSQQEWEEIGAIRERLERLKKVRS